MAAVEFFPTDEATIENRVSATFDAAVDSNGNALFPDHRVPGTPGFNLKKISVRLMLRQYRETNATLSDMSPRTASRTGLDQWGSFMGTPRKGATASSGVVKITSTQDGSSLVRQYGTSTLVSGTTLTSGSLTMQLIDDAVIPLDGTETTARVETTNIFAFSTLEPGTRIQLTSNNPLRNSLIVEAATAITGGRSTETDDQYRFRLMRSFKNINTYEGFIAELLGDTDVSNVDIRPNRYGPGTAEVFVTPAIAFPTSNLRVRLENLYRGPSRIYITFPRYEAVALRIRITGNPSAAAIVSYINNIPAGQILTISQIERVVLENGGTDAQVLQIRRGITDTLGNIIEPVTLNTVTNLTPKDTSTKWYTRTDLITFCS